MGQFALLQNSSQLWIADESRAAPMNYAGMPNVVPPGLTVNSTVIVDKMNVANQRIDFR
jgi:hypothetical protein